MTILQHGKKVIVSAFEATVDYEYESLDKEPYVQVTVTDITGEKRFIRVPKKAVTLMPGQIEVGDDIDNRRDLADLLDGTVIVSAYGTVFRKTAEGYFLTVGQVARYYPLDIGLPCKIILAV